MSNITTDFISATKKIHADVRAILQQLKLIKEDVNLIKDQSGPASNGTKANEEHPRDSSLASREKDPDSYEAKQYALDKERFGLDKRTANLSIWTLIILGVYTGMTGIMTWEAKKSAEAATHALVASNRSWIAPDAPVRVVAQGRNWR